MVEGGDSPKSGETETEAKSGIDKPQAVLRSGGGHMFAQGVSPETVELAKVIERSRVARTAIICLAIVLGLGMITYGFVRVVEKPAWLEVLILLLAALSAPSGVFAVLIHSRKKAVGKFHRRTKELEKHVDKDRSSSALES